MLNSPSQLPLTCQSTDGEFSESESDRRRQVAFHLREQSLIVGHIAALQIRQNEIELSVTEHSNLSIDSPKKGVVILVPHT